LFGIRMQHSYREANQVVDSLTMYDLSQLISLKMLNLVPIFLPLPIFRDLICTSIPRCFLSTFVSISESQNNRGKMTTLKQIKH